MSVEMRDIDVIRVALEHARDNQDDRCAETGCMCDIAHDERCSLIYTEALKSLEGLCTAANCILLVEEAMRVSGLIAKKDH